MNKNNQAHKTNRQQGSFQVKSTIGNKVEKSKQIQKPKEIMKHLNNKNNKLQNRQRIKQNNKTLNNNNDNYQNNNARLHSRSKSKSKPINQKCNKKDSSRNREKSEISNKNIFNNQHFKNGNDNKEIIFQQPLSFEKEIKSDINNTNFIEQCQNKIKIDLKKITKNSNIDKEILKSIINIDNLNYIPLNDLSSLFNTWQEITLFYKRLEEELLKKNNFEIDKKTLEIRTKNAESCEKLKNPKFWILYVEYLINNSLLIKENQFLSVINEAFSYMESDSDSAQLRIYYLQKIKKYSPCFFPDGNINDTDDVYLNKLNKSTVNFIKSQKEFISSNIKLKSANKKKLYIISTDINKFENNKFNEVIKPEKCLKENEIKNLNKKSDKVEKDIINYEAP